jgi:hypothetical protein
MVNSFLYVLNLPPMEPYIHRRRIIFGPSVTMAVSLAVSLAVATIPKVGAVTLVAAEPVGVGANSLLPPISPVKPSAPARVMTAAKKLTAPARFQWQTSKGW